MCVLAKAMLHACPIRKKAARSKESTKEKRSKNKNVHARETRGGQRFAPSTSGGFAVGILVRTVKAAEQALAVSPSREVLGFCVRCKTNKGNGVR